MNKLEALLGGASMLAIMAGGDTFAQQASPVTYTGTPNPAAAIFGPANGVTSCNTTAQTAAQDTVTITPGSNQYVYITGVYVDIVATAVGAAQVATASFSNVDNSPTYSLATITAAAAGYGTFRQISEKYNPPLRSSAPGTAVNWTPSATISNSVMVCPRVAAYIAQ